MSDNRPEVRIKRLVGVYDAEGTLRGELAYWVGARLGQAHCALCDITHGLVRERADWRARRARLPVPFDTYHRNDQPPEVRRSTADVAPAVVAETDRGVVALLGPPELDACHGSINRLVDAIEAAAAHARLRWPEGPPST
jgi:hypothetical protein